VPGTGNLLGRTSLAVPPIDTIQAMSKQKNGKKRQPLVQIRPPLSPTAQTLTIKTPEETTHEPSKVIHNALARAIANNPVFTIVASGASIIGFVLALYPMFTLQPEPTLFIHNFSVYGNIIGSFPHFGVEFTATNPRTASVTFGPCELIAFYDLSGREISVNQYHFTDTSDPPSNPPRFLTDEFVTIFASETKRFHIVFEGGGSMSLDEQERFRTRLKRPPLADPLVISHAKLSCLDERKVPHSTVDFFAKKPMLSASRSVGSDGIAVMYFLQAPAGFRPEVRVEPWSLTLPTR